MGSGGSIRCSNHSSNEYCGIRSAVYQDTSFARCELCRTLANVIPEARCIFGAP